MTATAPRRINARAAGWCEVRGDADARPAAMPANGQPALIQRGPINPQKPFTDCPCWLAKDAAPAR